SQCASEGSDDACAGAARQASRQRIENAGARRCHHDERCQQEFDAHIPTPLLPPSSFRGAPPELGFYPSSTISFAAPQNDDRESSSLRGAQATKQSSLSMEAFWIASLALAMTEGLRRIDAHTLAPARGLKFSISRSITRAPASASASSTCSSG